MTSLFRYMASAGEDLLIARWWARMHEDDDLDKLFTRDAQTLAALLRIVAPPKLLVYALDGPDIWFATWFEPFFNSVAAGMWVRRDRRSTRGGLDAVLHALEIGLTASPTILGITKQPTLIDEHVKLGYNVLGPVPELWDGETAWVLVLTRDRFAKTLERYRRPRAAQEVAHGLGG